jgi:hypothetical protein
MQVPAATPAAATGVGAAEEIEESSLNAAAFSRENGCGGSRPSEFGVRLGGRVDLPARCVWSANPTFSASKSLRFSNLLPESYP